MSNYKVVITGPDEKYLPSNSINSIYCPIPYYHGDVNSSLHSFVTPALYFSIRQVSKDLIYGSPIPLNDQIRENLKAYSQSLNLDNDKLIETSTHLDPSKLPVHNTMRLRLASSYPISAVDDQTKSILQDLSFSDSSTPLPHGVKKIAHNYIAIERPPFQADVHFKPYRASSGSREIPSVKVWFPWTLTFIYLDKSGNPTNQAALYFSDSSIESEDSKIIPCYFPNTYNSAKICFSNSLSSIPLNTDYSNNISNAYSIIINDYISGGWNLDLGIPIRSLFTALYSSQYSMDPVDDSVAFEFLNPTRQSLNDRFPDFSESKITTLLNNAHSSNDSPYSKYFFQLLSRLSLKETLSLVKTLSKTERNTFRTACQENLDSISDIDIGQLISSSSHYVQPNYSTTPDKIISYFSINTHTPINNSSRISSLLSKAVSENICNILSHPRCDLIFLDHASSSYQHNIPIQENTSFSNSLIYAYFLFNGSLVTEDNLVQNDNS